MKSYKNLTYLPLFAGVLLFLVEAARLFLLLRLPDIQLIQHIPDDGFYYLVLAKNFALHGTWSFDGTAPSTGFHLLWAYLLSALYKVNPAFSFHQLVILGGLIGALALATAGAFSVIVAKRLFSETAALGVLFIFLGAGSLLDALWLMETPFVLLAASTYLLILTNPNYERATTNSILAFGAGFLGMLSRSDFGLVPFLFLVAYIVLALLQKNLLPQLKVAASGLIGAIAGLAFITIHSYLVSGHLTQGSAREKLLWSHIEGFSTVRPFRIFFGFVYPATNFHVNPLLPRSRWVYISLLIGFVLLCALLFAIYKQLASRISNESKAILLTSVGLIVAYTCLYRFDSSAIQPWYAASYQIPTALIAAAAFDLFARHIRSSVLVAFVAVWAFLGIYLSLAPTWPLQEDHYMAGIYLQNHPEIQPAGAWNAGIVSYFSNQPIINLDGLVNDDVYSFSAKNDLADYILKRKIEYLVDTQQMFAGTLPRRGGYDGPRLTHCLDSKNDFLRDGSEELGPPFMRHAIYHVNLSCLANESSVQ